MPITHKPQANQDGARVSATPEDLKQLEKSHKKGGRKLLATSVLWSMVAFVALNGVLWSFSKDDRRQAVASGDSQKELWSGTGSIDLAVNGFNALKERPNVVLLGSSLIMHPFWAMDAEDNKAIGDIFHHHGSAALEKKLAGAAMPNEKVYSFAIFGQMISDAFIYVDDFLKGAKKPDVLFFGIAPRDFSDADLPVPMATMTFKRLVGLENFGRYADFYLPSVQDKADFVASHSCYFYGKRWRLQHEVNKAIEKAYDAVGLQGLVGQIGLDTTTAIDDKPQAGFMLSGTAQERWNASLKEYAHRYRGIDQKDLSVQWSFLDRLLTTCRQRGIHVVVVNMPLTEQNRALLPAGFYDAYRARVKAIADKPMVQFVDLGSSPQFTAKDFWDTAHLNHLGGRKLIDATLPAMKAALSEAQTPSN